MALGAEAKAASAFDFDIPEQRLEDALLSFSSATGIEVLAKGGLLSGLRSSPVAGHVKASDALNRLLEKTPLKAKPLTQNAFVLIKKPIEAVSRAKKIASEREAFSARLQSAVLNALCGDALTRPGQYRALLKIWLERSGAVKKVTLADTTGNGPRDQAIVAKLNGLDVGGSLPTALPQPAFVLIAAPPENQREPCSMQP